MTKLKKSKKRTKQKFSPADLASESDFAEFCKSIEQRWIPPSDYQWGIDCESLFGPDDCFTQLYVKKSLSIDAGQLNGHLNKLKDISAFDHRSVMEILAVVNCIAKQGASGNAKQARKLTGEQVGCSISKLVEQIVADERDLLLEYPVAHQILHGEVPLTIGLRFPTLTESPELLEMGRRNLTLGLEELLDSDGLPHARYLAEAGLLLASWTRCQKLCDLFNTECFDIDAQTQFEYFVRQVMRLMRKDGSLVFSDDGMEVKKPIQAAVDCYHDEYDTQLARLLFPKAKKGKSKKPSLNSLPEASVNSEWGELAILQTEWIPKSPRLTVDYRDRQITAELSAGGVLLSGEMQHEFVIDGEPVSADSDWEVVCWHSDQDGDFLELETVLSDGSKWQKHFLLARNELFLLVGDVILGEANRPIEFSSQWPLHSGAGFGAARETNEFFLTRKSKTAAAVLPLGMPEWRTERADTTITISESRLSCQATVTGENFYCPYFIDLDPKRCRKPLTWRRLTVAEKLEILPPSAAAAFRIHVGDQQWLIYRSLNRPQSRTVFGQNLNVEFYAGTFESDGTCGEIISVS